MFAAVAHPKYLIDKARQMRIERRMTLDEIAERLALPKTTVWYWIADLPPIDRHGRQNLGQRLGSEAMQRKYRALREEAYREGCAEFEALCEEPTFRDFVCLYIAEGCKRNRNRISLCNSDPVVIALADRWIRTLSDSTVTYSLQYHADQDLDELRTFWSGVVSVDANLIRMQRKSNSAQLRKRTWRSAHGVLTVTVNDTQLRSRLQGWMDCLRNHWLHSASLGA